MGCNCKLFVVAAACYGISVLLGYAESRPRWASEFREVLPENEALCDHNRVGTWFGLFTYGSRGCAAEGEDDDRDDVKYSGRDYVNYRAFEFARSSTTILAIASLVVGGYYVLTGCCGRSRRLETTAGVAMNAAGAYVIFAVVYWHLRFAKRPDNDETDDRETCDVGCQMAGAAGVAAVLLGLAMNGLANEKHGGAPPAPDAETGAFAV